ncbi:MAG TPA: glycosyltransferase family 4 protein [Planctomycetota bacterium]|nr:glycosyltransferase family 4 protein [Planctomycetota bacterium]
MNIVQLTPGAGGMYCGACMRDNALAAALRKLGHDTLLIPLYTPLTTEEKDNSHERIFFGGLNVFLQQKAALFRKTPEWVDRGLDNPALIKKALSFGIKTEPKELGELTISMLKGEDGFQAKELSKLTRWLSENSKPDVICLSNILLAGVTRQLQKTLKVPVLCTLQGEDFFLDGLPAPQRTQAWDLLRERAAEIDGFIAVSDYYGKVMQSRLALRPERIHVIHNGIDVTGYEPSGPAGDAVPVLGFLARMAPEKGLRTLVDAFRRLRASHPALRLHVAGSKTAGDESFVSDVQTQLKKDGLSEHVSFFPNVTRQQKIDFLRSLTVFSVPAEYGESFGLYVLEALACGVPVVQPGNGGFPEILAQTGGGKLYEPGNVTQLASHIDALLLNADLRRELGNTGRKAVLEKFTLERMAADVATTFQKVRESHGKPLAGATHGK